jgi:hypothetical protein
MLTEAEIAFLTAAFPTIEAIIKAAFAAHSAGTLSLADAKAAITGGLQGVGSLSAIDAAEDAKLEARFETTTPVPK